MDVEIRIPIAKKRTHVLDCSVGCAGCCCTILASFSSTVSSDWIGFVFFFDEHPADHNEVDAVVTKVGERNAHFHQLIE